MPPVYRLNGVVDAFSKDIVLTGNMLHDESMLGFVIEEKYSVDIDTEFDFKYCEFLLSHYVY